MATIRLCAFSDEAADSIDGQIAALKRNEISLTELRSVDKKNVSLFTEAEAAEYARKLNGEGITVWSVGSPLGKTDISIGEKEWTESVKRICGIANALGTERVRAFSFFHAYGQGGRVIERMNRAAEIAKTFGVTLCHENEKDVYGDVYDRVLELMETLDGWKFIYDPANFIQVGERAERTLPLANSCEYFHIKDVIVKTGELVPAGEGDGEIGKLLQSVDRDIVLTVEPHLATFSSYAQIDGSEMKLKYRFESNAQAFDAAVSALKKLLDKGGYRPLKGGYVR